MTLRIGELCAGYGGLSMAVQAVIPAEVAWFADNNPAAATVLKHHWPDTPNHGDITTVDWSTVEPVDILTAGFPCQPVSNAGLRKGLEDERWLWPEIARAIGALRPSYVVLENVAAIATRGLDTVLGDLAALGFDAEWGTLRASDVGAPHQRNRWFCLAWPADAPGNRWDQRGTESTRIERGPDTAELGATSPENPDIEPRVERRVAAPRETSGGGATARRSLTKSNTWSLLPTPRTSDTNGPGLHGAGGLDLRTAVTLLPIGVSTVPPSPGGNESPDDWHQRPLF